MQRTVEEGETVTGVIVECVAEETDQEPEDLQPFAEAIDADAVEAFYEHFERDGKGKLTVVYEGCRVAFDGTGVTVQLATQGQSPQEIREKTPRFARGRAEDIGESGLEPRTN